MQRESVTRVLVTAAGSGIGLEIAKEFVRRGAAVAICAISESNLKAAATVIPEANCHVADVADPQQVDELFDRVKDVLGGLDVLGNNAGIGGPTAAVEDVSVADWDRTMAVNINGQFYCARRAVPLLKAAGGGSISKPLIRRRTPWLSAAHAVCSIQMGSDWIYKEPGNGIGTAQHSCQRTVARIRGQ